MTSTDRRSVTGSQDDRRRVPRGWRGLESSEEGESKSVGRAKLPYRRGRVRESAHFRDAGVVGGSSESGHLTCSQPPRNRQPLSARNLEHPKKVKTPPSAAVPSPRGSRGSEDGFLYIRSPQCPLRAHTRRLLGSSEQQRIAKETVFSGETFERLRRPASTRSSGYRLQVTRIANTLTCKCYHIAARGNPKEPVTYHGGSNETFRYGSLLRKKSEFYGEERNRKTADGDTRRASSGWRYWATPTVSDDCSINDSRCQGFSQVIPHFHARRRNSICVEPGVVSPAWHDTSRVLNIKEYIVACTGIQPHFTSVACSTLVPGRFVPPTYRDM
ncbi:hypothetical protein HPB51_013301 [Rhipicephalus microplus]|uniref:Uncharacterized protein n=1 Tax=Rhipicephalus microplus TaxID=6941 RepID=A0A9J6DH10_RHIMP|nr:hypothetical protein HPB51_013301 [Rhipicephalus microplus]